jgi:hypothetical protein
LLHELFIKSALFFPQQFHLPCFLCQWFLGLQQLFIFREYGCLQNSSPETPSVSQSVSQSPFRSLLLQELRHSPFIYPLQEEWIQ